MALSCREGAVFIYELSVALLPQQCTVDKGRLVQAHPVLRRNEPNRRKPPRSRRLIQPGTRGAPGRGESSGADESKANQSY